MDSYPVKRAHRPEQCLGSALSHAIALLECSYPGMPARVMTFIGGPCTRGPGKVAELDMKVVMRSWKDILDEETSSDRRIVQVRRAFKCLNK